MKVHSGPLRPWLGLLGRQLSHW